MAKVNYYKLAPTFLYNLQGDSKLFNTQDEVDAAWKEGWFGPPWLSKDAPRISELEWETKQDMIDATHDDPRYKGLYLSKRKNTDTLKEEILAFEEEKKVTRTIGPEED